MESTKKLNLSQSKTNLFAKQFRFFSINPDSDSIYIMKPWLNKS